MLEFVDPPKVTDEPVRINKTTRTIEANPLFAHLKRSYEERKIDRAAPSEWTGATIVLTIMDEDAEQFKRLIKQAAAALEIGYESSYEIIEGCARRIKFAARPKRTRKPPTKRSATPTDVGRAIGRVGRGDIGGNRGDAGRGGR